MTIDIVHEDDDVVVIHKPAGVVVNRAASVKGATIQDWAESKLAIQSMIQESDDDAFHVFQDRSGLAHRIDKDTSGCLLIAKHPRALQSLLAQFKSRTIEKKYTALVYGAVAPEKGTITAPIGRLPWRRGLFGVMPGGKHAVSHYKLVRSYHRKKELYSLLEVQIETGRTHQIRVHLQYIRHPIVGDPFYAGKKRVRKDAAWCPRLFLHASHITFTQPTTGMRVSCACALPQELKTVLEQLSDGFI